MQKHLKPIGEVLESTAFFTSDEVKCALSLADEVLEKGNNDYIFYVYEDREKPVGFIIYGPITVSDKAYDLYWIVVHKDCQGKGVGKALMDFMETDLKKKGARMVIAETSSLPLYEPTRKFYARAGYLLEATVKDFYKPGDDRLLFVKRLKR
jgi:ribosomal protein S18 acetylase RimI-like enzyme